MSINYDFGDLEAFLAVKETGSFHAAANRLNLSQSAITRRIQKLEEALDSQLFMRSTRAVRPTLAAKRLQSRAEAMLQDARETSQAMRDESVALAHQRNAVVTIAAIPTVIGRVLLPALSEFRAEGNLARVRVLDVAANEVAEAVAQGDADFGLSSIPIIEPTTEFEPLIEEQIVVALPNAHPMTQLDRLTWPSLKDTPVILPSRGTGNRLLIDEALAKERHSLAWSYEVQRTSTAIQLVTQGLGVALVPETAARSSNLPIRPLPTPIMARSIGVLTRIGYSEPKLAQTLKWLIRRNSDRVNVLQ